MDFNEYWKQKSAKRRKGWSGKARRYAERHDDLESIHKEVFLPLDYTLGLDLDDYKSLHHVSHNPIAEWHQGVFHFTEQGLRDALAAQGADLNLFKMEVSRKSIVGETAPQPDICRGPGHKVYEFERTYHTWLKRVYEICTEVEVVRLSYREISMVIRRYTTGDSPFAHYELNPCEQLTLSVMLMEETSFNALDISTLLLEMSAEWELRQEEFNYYAKALKLRMMESVTVEGMELVLWDDKKLKKKVEEYVQKGTPYSKMLGLLLRPYLQAVKKYVEAISDQDVNVDGDKITEPYVYNYTSRLEPRFRSFFDKNGLADVRICSESKYVLSLEYGGSGAKLYTDGSSVTQFYPDWHFKRCGIIFYSKTSLTALVAYLKEMPAMNQRVEEYIIKAVRHYDALMCQHNDGYRNIVETYGALAEQYVGTPVGKLMKYLRWNASRLDWTRRHSFKALQDNKFSYVLQGWRGTKEVEKWLDADCHNVYDADPATTTPPSEEIYVFLFSDINCPHLLIDFIDKNF